MKIFAAPYAAVYLLNFKTETEKETETEDDARDVAVADKPIQNYS